MDFYNILLKLLVSFLRFGCVLLQFRGVHMKAMVCEMCNSNDLLKQDGMFVCQSCGTKYSVEEAKKLMIEGTVDVQGTVKVDNTAFVEKYLVNARRAYTKEDWAEVEKYYNLVEQNAPNNIEAVFFSAFGKTMLSFTDSDYNKRQHNFKVLQNSISVINDYYEVTNEDKQKVLTDICNAIIKMHSGYGVCDKQPGMHLGSLKWQTTWYTIIKDAFVKELNQIAELHNDAYIQELKNKLSELGKSTSGFCYVATAIYGSYDCAEVWTLRRFRDNTLASTWYGRAFIKTYYAISPTLVKWFGETQWFKNMWKPVLDKMVKNLNNKGVENTPYNDKEW